MAKRVQRRRGTTTEHSTFMGAVGEITVDIDKDTVVVHDGVTDGGFPLAREDMSNVTNRVGVTQLNCADGSANQALKTDGAGTISFGTIDIAGSTIGGDLSGTVGNAQIIADAVGTTELAADAVTTVKITDANVTDTKLATDSVTTIKILDDNVTTAKIADSAITSAQILNGTIVADDLAINSVTTNKILDANVSSSKLSNDAVINAKIANNAVTTAKIATDAVGIPQLALQDGTLNQAIVTDGSGTIRFATVGAGGAVGSSVYVEDIFTGDGTTATFSLSVGAPYEESILTFIDGVAQPTSAFTLPSATSITFSPAPSNGAAIRVCHLGIASSLALGGETVGDVIYYNGTSYQRLGIGTAGQHLATNNAANAPEWVTPATPPSGKVLQMKSNLIGTTDSTTLIIPGDNTIPQITEGKEFCNLAFTPTSATSKILITVQVTYWLSLFARIYVAAFQSGVNNALASSYDAGDAQTPGEANTFSFSFVVDSGSTTARTYSMRFGGSGSYTANININNRFGGSVQSGLIIQEIEV